LSQIIAKIIADSYSAINGKRITTFELVYPRFIHSELMTHRLFSRNAMSSRAVPIQKMIKQIRNNPAEPIHWGVNGPGMQAKEELQGFDLGMVQQNWLESAGCAAIYAENMEKCGAHKQIVNRILEPFQLMKTVLTATEFDNFFWLRCHQDAQPEIKELADNMYAAMQENSPYQLSPGDWHTPYYADGVWFKDSMVDSLEDALAISSSCCAQVSYRLLDDSIEKARKVYERLVKSTPVHASPFEHCASPMLSPEASDTTWFSSWSKGITHVDKDGNFWSGNFKSWIQYRQLIDGNVCNKYED
jgi:thymidylate synthase ThyX